MENLDLSKVSAEDLRKALQERLKQEQIDREREKQAYENERDELINEIIEKSVKISVDLKLFKEGLSTVFNDHEERLKNYGGIRSNSKGGFSLIHSSGNFKVSRIRATEPIWDERSVKAEELISDFLRDTVKKKDSTLFEILYSFIQKNEKGELEYSKVMHLFKHRNKYSDARWVEGLNLIQESYSAHLKGFRYDFYKKNEEGKWEKIEINFTSL
jgi:hypothetical protein